MKWPCSFMGGVTIVSVGIVNGTSSIQTCVNKPLESMLHGIWTCEPFSFLHNHGYPSM